MAQPLMKHHLKFLVLKYAPRPIDNNSVCIGVLAFEVDTGSYTEVRFIKTWEPVLRLDPDADLEVLGALKREIEIDWPDREKRERLVNMFLGTFSNALQVQEVSSLTETPAQEMDAFASQYLRS